MEQKWGCWWILVQVAYKNPSKISREVQQTYENLHSADNEHFSFHDQVILESLEICNAEVTELAFEVTAHYCPNTKELKLLNCQMMSDLCNFYHILMENISFDRSIFKTVPASYLTPVDKGLYDNQHNIEDLKRVLGEVK